MKYKYATVVPLSEVTLSGSNGGRTVTKMTEVLKKQGQIEPLQVRDAGFDGKVQPHPEDVHGNDIVRAARVLGWPTLLVVSTDRYKE